MCRTSKKGATLGKMHHAQQTAPHSEQCGTLGKMHDTWKNAPHLAKCAALTKRATLGTMRHP